MGLWLGIVLAFLAVYTADLRLSYAMLAAPCDGPDCHYQAIGAAEAAALARLGLPVSAYAAYMLGITLLIVGAFTILSAGLFVRMYPKGVGLLFSAVMVIIPATAITSVDVVAAVYPAWLAPIYLLYACGHVCMITFLLAFPNGRLEPKWTVILPLLAAAASMLDLLVEDLRSSAAFAGFYLTLLISILAIVLYRYNRLFDRTQRQKARWVVFGIAIFLAGVPAWAYTFEWSRPAPGFDRLLTILGGWTVANLLTLALPASIFIAIINDRLWDIDLIVRKTVVYALLTASLAGIYFSMVLLLQTLFSITTGQNSPIANLISTLVIAALFQPLRDRLQRGVNRLLFGDRDDPNSVLTKLGQRLQEAAEPGEMLTAISATLCQALKLPYAAIILQGAGGERLTAASSGQRPAAVREWPLRFQGLPVGWLAIGLRSPGEEFSDQEEKLLANVASHAGAAAHAAQLTGSLQQSRERLVLAREEERRRIRRDLHDGLGPTLASQTFALDAALDLLESDPSAAAVLLRSLKLQNQGLVTDIRHLVYELRPPTLDELGLADALGVLLQQLGSHSPTRVSFTSEPKAALDDLPAAVEVAVYRLVQEGVNNVMRHAGATACAVECRRDSARLILTIRDDGRGIPVNAAGNIGMLSMRERVEELGDRLTVAPVEPSGTLITAELPVVRITDERANNSDPGG